MKGFIANHIISLLFQIYRIKGKFVKKDGILIIPHASMCSVDHYDIINYKSDSALTFLHYLLDNKLQMSKEIFVAVSDNVDIDKYVKYVARNYPNRKISFITFFWTKEYKFKEKILKLMMHHNCIIHCSHIFSSTTYELYKLVNKDQLLYNLNYYTASMKNDIFQPGDPIFIDYANIGREYTYTFLPSELSIRLSVAEYGSIPYWKFKKLGLCRNDNMLNGDDCKWLREEIAKKVSYPLKTIVLYTPTHRDFGLSKSTSESDSVLGFKFDEEKFSQFIRDNGIVIYCKLHPKRVVEVINNDKFPEGIIVHLPSEKYGLTEMMQVSDVLLTDYTSGYFDFLLLDKPVIFNLYDIETYKATRGLPYDPYDSVIAGDIVMTEEELKIALTSLDRNSEKYKEKRSILRKLFFTNIDGNTCKRVYDFVYNTEQA